MVETCRQRVHFYPPNSRTRGSISSPAGCGWWAGVGPGAGGGAELLAGGGSFTVTITATQQEAVLGVVPPPHHQPRQLTRDGGGGEEHLRGLVSTIIYINNAPSYQDG